MGSERGDSREQPVLRFAVVFLHVIDWWLGGELGALDTGSTAS